MILSQPLYCTLTSVVITLTLAPSPMAGQRYTLTCAVTGGDSLTPTITYQFTQDNPGQTGVVGGVLTTPTLTFNPLMLSNSGQYSCRATITSPHLNTPQVLGSGSQDLMVQGESVNYVWKCSSILIPQLPLRVSPLWILVISLWPPPLLSGVV